MFNCVEYNPRNRDVREENKRGFQNFIKNGRRKLMICNECKVKDECDWYSSYQTILKEIYLGIGAGDALGAELLGIMNNYSMNQCDYFE